MTQTTDVVPVAQEAPSAAPSTFTVARPGGFFATNGLGRKGTFAGPIDLTVADGRLTAVGPYLGRKTAARTVAHWVVFLAVVAVVTLALSSVTTVPFAVAVSIVAAGLSVMLLDWTRRRTRTVELAATDATVERVRGRRLRIAGPFELERPDVRQTLAVACRTKDEAAALARALKT